MLFISALEEFCVDNTFKDWHLLIRDRTPASFVGEKQFFAMIIFLITPDFCSPHWAVIRPVQQGKPFSASPADVTIEGF